MMRRVLTSLLLLVLVQGAAWGCFGPKLYIGIAADPQQRPLYELVALYVKEKTGTESVRVELGDSDPLNEVREARVDMVFLADGQATGELEQLLAYPALPGLFSGARPLEDLQFATLRPALEKLQGRLRRGDIETLLQRVNAGQPPAAAARLLLTELGLI